MPREAKKNSNFSRTTSGQAPLTRLGNIYSARVELSVKVIDTYEKLFQTLCHELCHVAAWLINHVGQPAHGDVWKRWMLMAKSIYPHIAMTTCHSYEIDFKFNYACPVETCDFT